MVRPDCTGLARAICINITPYFKADFSALS
jgi:hypothetical protein